MERKETARVILGIPTLYVCSLLFSFGLHQAARLAMHALDVGGGALVQWAIFPASHALVLALLSSWLFGSRSPGPGVKSAGLFLLHIGILIVSTKMIRPEEILVEWQAPLVAGVKTFGPDAHHAPETAFVILKRSSFIFVGPLLLSLAAVGVSWPRRA